MTDTTVLEVSATDVTKRLTDILNNTNLKKTRYIVRRHGKAVVAVVTIEDLETLLGHKIDATTRTRTAE